MRLPWVAVVIGLSAIIAMTSGCQKQPDGFDPENVAEGLENASDTLLDAPANEERKAVNASDLGEN